MKYVQVVVSNIEEYLDKQGNKLQAHAPELLFSGYHLDIDIINELREDKVAYYHLIIGVLCWIVELGRANICCKDPMNNFHLTLLRCGNLAKVLHIFVHLIKRTNL